MNLLTLLLTTDDELGGVNFDIMRDHSKFAKRLCYALAIGIAAVALWVALLYPTDASPRTRAMWLLSTNLAGVCKASVLITNEGTVPVNLEFYKVDASVGWPVIKRFSPTVRISPREAHVVSMPTAVASSGQDVLIGLTEHTFRSSASRWFGKIPSVRIKQALPKSWLTTECFALKLEAPIE